MYLIISDSNEQGTLETLPKTDGLTLITEKQLIESNITLSDDDIYAISTEGVINAVNQQTTSSETVNATNLLKDKVLFRQTIANLFEDYNFFSVKIADLANINITNKMVVKPSKGFFGTGIRMVDQSSDLNIITEEIVAEIEKNSAAFANSESILDGHELLVEDFIEGKEYAIDMFYDGEGKPQLLNIYYHPLPHNEAYIHAMYCSSREIYNDIAEKSLALFEKLNQILNVKNYVMHAEFKFDGEKLTPIEINPLRLGGMGLGNMSYHALNVNPYEYLIKGQAPDWKAIWSDPKHDDAVYNFLIAYNSSNVDTNTQKPDIEKLKADLGETLNETHFDYKKSPVFGIFTTKETAASMEKLKSIEFNDYFS